MKVRLGLVLTAAVLFAGSGCAAGGSGGGAAPTGPAMLGGEVLEEGVSPRKNSHTNSAELYLAQAQSASDEAQAQTRYQQALEAAQDGIAADPENPFSYFLAAQAMVGLEDFAGAATMFDKAEELHPRYKLETEPWRERGWIGAYNAAVIPMNNGELEAAAELFEEADALYSGRPEALLQLGSIYSRLNETDKAVETFQKALGILEESKETQMADTINAPIWQQHYDIATTSLGQTLTFAERYDEAAELYSQLLKEKPNDVTILSSLANVLSQVGQADSAQALYDQLLNRDDLGERELFNAGVGLYQVENYKAAARAFKKAAEMNPFNRDARLNYLMTLFMEDAWEEAIPAARDLLKVDPRNGVGWLYLTRALSETEQVEEANQVFNQYQEIGYEITDLSLQPNANGGTRISGSLKNTSLEPGTVVTIRFHFGGPDGQEIGTTDVRVQAPEAEMAEFFQGEFVSTEPTTGYTYEIINP